MDPKKSNTVIKYRIDKNYIIKVYDYFFDPDDIIR